MRSCSKKTPWSQCRTTKPEQAGQLGESPLPYEGEARYVLHGMRGASHRRAQWSEEYPTGVLGTAGTPAATHRANPLQQGLTAFFSRGVCTMAV